MQPSTDVVSVRIPSKLKKRLSSIAKKMDRSQNWVFTHALEGYVSLYDWQVKEIEKAVYEADHGGKFTPHDEVMGALFKSLP